MISPLRRPLGFAFRFGVLCSLAVLPQAAAQQTPQPAAQQRRPAPQVLREEDAILQALAANPVTAPYRIGVTKADGRYVLRGRVGTKQVHDAAVQTALSLGLPIVDNLVIDTAATLAAAATAPNLMPLAGGYGPMMASRLGMNTYIYPPPLFGRYDDPFFGLEPPVISYPPWWRSVAYRQPLDPSLTGPYPVPPVGSMPVRPQASSAPQGVVPSGMTLPSQGNAPAPQDGTIELTINSQGQAVLRGTVPTLADRISVGQRIAQVPGIAEVVNLLSVKEAGTGSTDASTGATPAPAATQPQPPPPPQPAGPETDAKPAPKTRSAPAVVAVDQSDLTAKVQAALNRRPALVGQPIQISSQDGTVYLTGKVPTVYEAMLAHRAAEQTPGVHEVIDQLEFVVPDADTRNPLLEKGRPEDIEAYLRAQIRRQVGDFAHVDRVEMHGDELQVQGTLQSGDDRPRLEAILRSMAVLRGFKVRAEFQSE